MSSKNELRAAVEVNAATLAVFASPTPALESVVDALKCLEDITGLDALMSISREVDGKLAFLERRAPGEYSHRLFVRDGRYVDYWIRRAEMGETANYELLPTLQALFAL